MNDALPQWLPDWSEIGYLVLPHDQEETVVAYASKAFGNPPEGYKDYRVLPDEFPTVTEALKNAMRFDPNFVLLPAEIVTESDIEYIEKVVSIGAGRVIFFGENNLLINPLTT